MSIWECKLDTNIPPERRLKIPTVFAINSKAYVTYWLLVISLALSATVLEIDA